MPPISNTTTSLERKKLRAQLKAARDRLSGDAALRASKAAAERLAASGAYAQAANLAAYMAVGNELDPAPLLAHAHDSGKTIYLPCIRPNRELLFAAWRPGEPLGKSRLGIREPQAGAKTIEAAELDLVIVPLVGFDRAGNRIGSGGGYYDRNFSFRRQPAITRPVLVGYGYALQECPHIESNDWDVPLDLIVTERGVHHCRSRL